MHTDRGRRLETNGEKDDGAASLYKVPSDLHSCSPPASPPHSQRAPNEHPTSPHDALPPLLSPAPPPSQHDRTSACIEPLHSLLRALHLPDLLCLSASGDGLWHLPRVMVAEQQSAKVPPSATRPQEAEDNRSCFSVTVVPSSSHAPHHLQRPLGT